jgi:enamine deaminase RidA (YjgF/YER057c/UK114 family)
MWLVENKPAFLLALIAGLVRKKFLIEIEAIAVAPQRYAAR